MEMITSDEELGEHLTILLIANIMLIWPGGVRIAISYTYRQISGWVGQNLPKNFKLAYSKMLQISLFVYYKFLVAMIVILVNFLVITVGKLDGKFFLNLLYIA